MSDMQAGEELDVLVAEKVMGAEWRDYAGGYRGLVKWDMDRKSYGILIVRNPDGSLNGSLPREWRFSADIAGAWSVLERLNAPGGEWPESHGWYVAVHNSTGAGWEAHVGHEVATAETAPLAICRAALAALRAVASPTNSQTSPATPRGALTP